MSVSAADRVFLSATRFLVKWCPRGIEITGTAADGSEEVIEVDLDTWMKFYKAFRADIEPSEHEGEFCLEGRHGNVVATITAPVLGAMVLRRTRRPLTIPEKAIESVLRAARDEPPL